MANNREAFVKSYNDLFALEYRQDEQLWYDIHPCLKEALVRSLTAT